MRYRGVPNWPPNWTLLQGDENKCPGGEIGILKSVTVSTVYPPTDAISIMRMTEHSSGTHERVKATCYWVHSQVFVAILRRPRDSSQPMLLGAYNFPGPDCGPRSQTGGRTN